MTKFTGKYNDLDHLQFKKAIVELQEKLKTVAYNGDYTTNQIGNACLNIVGNLCATEIRRHPENTVPILLHMQAWVDDLIDQVEQRLDPNVRQKLAAGI